MSRSYEPLTANSNHDDQSLLSFHWSQVRKEQCWGRRGKGTGERKEGRKERTARVWRWTWFFIHKMSCEVHVEKPPKLVAQVLSNEPNSFLPPHYSTGRFISSMGKGKPGQGHLKKLSSPFIYEMFHIIVDTFLDTSKLTLKWRLRGCKKFWIWMKNERFEWMPAPPAFMNGLSHSGSGWLAYSFTILIRNRRGCSTSLRPASAVLSWTSRWKDILDARSLPGAMIHKHHFWYVFPFGIRLPRSPLN